MITDRTILITGVKAIRRRGRAGVAGQRVPSARLTRKPESERAAALARRGVDIIKGDLDDEATRRVRWPARGASSAVQNSWEAGVERERRRQASGDAGPRRVEHYVYTSVGSAHKRTGIPHFDNKWRIEETVRGLDSVACDPASGVLPWRTSWRPTVSRATRWPGRSAGHEVADDCVDDIAVRRARRSPTAAP